MSQATPATRIMKCKECDIGVGGRCHAINFCLVVTTEDVEANAKLNPSEITQYGNSRFKNNAVVGSEYGCNLHSDETDTYGVCADCVNWEKYRHCGKVAHRGDWQSFEEADEIAVNFFCADPFNNWLEFGKEFGCIHFAGNSQEDYENETRTEGCLDRDEQRRP